MPLDKPSLENGIVSMLDNLYNNATSMTTAQARTAFASQLATLIETYVKTGLVNVTVTVAVTTATGGAGTGSGSGTGNIT